jgi:hypothetical protein
MRRVNKLSQMKIDEVSLVDQDANGFADMLIAKRDDSEEQMSQPQGELTFSDDDLVYDDEGRAYLPVQLAETDADEDEDDAEPYSAEDDEADDEDQAEETANAVLQGLSKALGDSDRDQVVAQAYGEINKAQRRAARAESVAKAERDLRLTREYITKAEAYSLPVPANVLGPVLKRCSESLSREDCNILAQCFDSASEASYDPYSEIGKSGGGSNTDILTEVDARAEELFVKGVEAGSGFTREQAVAKVFDINPQAYDEYHVNQPLTNVSIAYMQSRTPSSRTRSSPRSRSTSSPTSTGSTPRATGAAPTCRSAPRAPSRRVSAGQVTTDTYFATSTPSTRTSTTRPRQRGLELQPGPGRHRVRHQPAPAQAGHRLDRALLQDRRLGDEKTGSPLGSPDANQFLQWDQAGSDPIGDVAGWIIDFRQLTGFAPNICVMGAYVMGAQAAPGHHRPDQVHPARHRHRGPDRDPVRRRRALRHLRHGGDRAGDQRRRCRTRGELLLHRQPQGRAVRLRPSHPSLLTPSRRLHLHLERLPRWQLRGRPDQAFRMEPSPATGRGRADLRHEGRLPRHGAPARPGAQRFDRAGADQHGAVVQAQAAHSGQSG